MGWFLHHVEQVAAWNWILVLGLGIANFAFPLFGIAARVDAAAVILPVQIVFSGKLDGTLVAALLLEVAGQPLDSVDVALFLHHLVEHLCVFHGADGERGGKVFAVQFTGKAGRFGEAQFETLAAACAPFGFIFESTDGVVEFFRVVFAFDQRDRILCFELGDESLDFFDAVAIFFVRRNIWIIVEKRYLEVLGQVFNSVAAARRTAGVQQERRYFAGAFQAADNII